MADQETHKKTDTGSSTDAPGQLSSPTVLTGTKIHALAGSSKQSAQPMRADQVTTLGLGGNFFHAVVQRLLSENESGLLYVQARGSNRAEALVAAEGTASVEILNADGNSSIPKKLGGIAGAISLGEGATVGCLEGSNGQTEIANALIHLPINVLSFSLTEKALREDNPVVIALAKALSERIKSNQNPLHIVCTVNFQGNASKVKEVLAAASETLGDGALTKWIGENLHAHDSAVDRMVWGGPLGTEPDPTDAVPYMPLVIKNTDVSLPAEFAAMIEDSPFCCFTDNLEAWEQQKLCGANGPHTFMASLGLLLGYRTVKESLADSEILEATSKYADKFAIPALEELVDPPPEGFMHLPFSQGFIERNRVACGMHPGFIHQDTLDIKVNARFSEFANQIEDFEGYQTKALSLAYALAIRAGTPLAAVEGKDGVYEVALDLEAKRNLSGVTRYDYLTGGDDADALKDPKALILDPATNTYEMRSELSAQLMGLWDQDPTVVASAIRERDILTSLNVPEQLHDEVIGFVVQLVSNKRQGVKEVLKSI